MEHAKSPSWLQELLDDTEARDQNHLLEMNKLCADQALAAIAVMEEKIAEVEQIAQQEIDLVISWKDSETTKLQNKINWLSFNLEKFVRASGEKTIRLPHGRLSLRAGKAKISVVDEAAFMKIAEKKGLIRIKPTENLPDLLKIHEFIRQHGFPPAGCSYTPATVNFSFKTTKGEQDVEQSSKAGTAVEPADQIEAAA
jgi:Bacteriophage Mu Gam like protein